MPRLCRSFNTWMLALVAACLVLSWPLHEARHAAEPLTLAAALAGDVDLADGPLLDPADDDTPDAPTGKAQGCVWCLFHGEHAIPAHGPVALAFHAESSPPPTMPGAGRPTGPCALAAHPRGPPQA